jgi:hypothetical protein
VAMAVLSKTPKQVENLVVAATATEPEVVDDRSGCRKICWS